MPQLLADSCADAELPLSSPRHLGMRTGKRALWVGCSRRVEPRDHPGPSGGALLPPQLSSYERGQGHWMQTGEESWRDQEGQTGGSHQGGPSRPVH